MPDWNGICCAVDFSEPSRLAMEQAAELARRFAAELTLVHVHEPPRAAATDFLASTAGASTEAAIEIEQTMEAWRSDAERLAGRAVRSRILMGPPAAEIVHFARERGCDLVVLATHGRTGITRLVLGSVAEQVVRQAPCPVLVARRIEATVSGSPARGTEPRRAG